jgi:putative RNA 2'-phosphotransferase
VKQISKFLALILRHRPEAGGIELDAAGWAPVEAVIGAVRSRFGPFDRAQLEQLVRTDDKRRYAFDASGGRIRASQGHSVQVDLDLAPIQPPLFLYHGTAERFLPSILEQGLKKGRRHHVHLSADPETARQVGRRWGGATIILEVSSGEMIGDAFYRSANGVWLTDHVGPERLRIWPGETPLCPQA